MVLDEPKWSSIQSLVEGLLATTPEQSPLRPEIIRAVGRTGLAEAIDLSFLTDDDIESLSSLKDVKTCIRWAREKAQEGRTAWEQGFTVRFDGEPAREQPTPRALDFRGPSASSRGGERAQAAVQGLAMASAMGELVQFSATIPAGTLSYAETEQQRLREFLAKAETFFVEKCVGCPRHNEIVQADGYLGGRQGQGSAREGLSGAGASRCPSWRSASWRHPDV